MDRRTIKVLCLEKPFSTWQSIMLIAALVLIIVTNLGGGFGIVKGAIVQNESGYSNDQRQRTLILSKDIHVSNESPERAVSRVVTDGTPAIEPIQSGLIKMRINRSDDIGNYSVSDADQLDREFMGLFDDLWRIKNNTAEAIIQLDYFSLRNDFRKRDRNKVSDFNKNLNNNRYQQQQQRQHRPPGQIGALPFNINTMSDSNTNRGHLTHRLGSYESPTTYRQPQNLMSPVSFAVFNNWFIDPIRTKLNKLHELFSGQPTARFQVMDAVKIGNRDATTAPTNNGINTVSSGATRSNRLKRQTGTCVPIGNERSCSKREDIISRALNTSFPGTNDAIENSCRQVAFLLIYCWPGLRKQVDEAARVSFGHSQSSLVTAEDFLKPRSKNSTAMSNIGRANHRSPDQVNCGGEHLSSTVRDRVVWMWLNLCMDKQFWSDYIENLSCLSLWSQERAQLVCSFEYGLMQAYLASNGSHSGQSHRRNIRADTNHYSNAVQSSKEPSSEQPTKAKELERKMLIGPSSNNPIVGQTGAMMKTGNPKQKEEEFDSKMHCCVFDHFIRCVYRQAYSDCGYKGAQFVVDFMSRIGTDDLKYICNSAPHSGSSKTHTDAAGTLDSTRHFKAGHKTEPSGNSSDVGTFIKSNYCEDSDIQYAMYTSTGNLSNLIGKTGFKRGKVRVKPGSASFNQYPYGGRYGMLGESNGCIHTIAVSMRIAFIIISVASIISHSNQLYSPLTDL